MDSSNHSPTDGNCPEISEDRKPILSLLTNELNNVPKSSSRSRSRSTKTTRGNKNWFPYRPRTRLAKKRLSSDVIVVSSDSEGSDVECNSNKMEIVPKTEIVSEESALQVVACVRVTGDHFAKQEMQQDSNYTNDNDSTGNAINQNDMLTSDLRSNDDYIQTVEDNSIDIGSTEKIVGDDMKQNITETAPKSEMISYDPVLQEAVVPHVSVTEDCKFLKQEATEKSDSDEVQQSTTSSKNVFSAVITCTLEGPQQNLNCSTNNTNELMLGENIGTAPAVQNDDLPLAEDDVKSTPSVSSKSQDESNTGSTEYEREYGQRPLERDDKSLKGLKRRLSTSDSIDRAAVIPEKRERTEF